MALCLSGKPGWESNSKGTYFPVTFMITETERASFQLGYGRDMSSLVSEWFPSDHPSVERVSMRSAGTNKDGEELWIISFVGSQDTSLNIYPKDVNKTKGISEFQFLPQHIGVRYASDNDYLQGFYSIESNTACKPGQLICINATDAANGTVDYTASPFTSASMISVFGAVDAPVINYIKISLNVKVKCSTYQVTYSNNNNSIDVDEWIGVNGSFGGYSPGATTSGLWLALGQTAEAGRSNGQIFHRTTRNMLKAPYINGKQLLWDPNKHGGTWTW